MFAAARVRGGSSKCLQFAQLACLCQGLSMLAWGIAPVIIDYLIRGSASIASYGESVSVLVLGIAFIGLHLLVRHNVRWALWAAYGVSAVLFLTTVAAALVLQTFGANSFLIVLSFATACACWMALDKRYSHLVEQSPASE